MLSFLISLVTSVVVVGTYHHLQSSDDNLISRFYHTDVATVVSPHGLRKHISKGDKDFILVDVRSQEEYEEEHIIGALNVPAYVDRNTSAYGDVERIVRGFKDIIKKYPHRDIIVYCYSSACMSGAKVGKMLADHGIYVKELGIGWNQWRYDWNSWNHQHEWDVTYVEDYIASGPDAGVYTGGQSMKDKCSESESFGC